MDIGEKVRSLVGQGGDDTYRHECADCGAEFESPIANPNDTACPECGSDRVHSAL